jgi:hypothetical protein
MAKSDYPLRHVCVSTAPSISPARVEQPGSNSTEFHEIWYFCIYLKPVEKIQISIKYKKNNVYFTWRSMNIYDNISLNYS